MSKPIKRITYTIAQLWYQITGPVVVLWQRLSGSVRAWMEWQDAKRWAKAIHPGWVQIATKARSEKTRMTYRNKILKAYRGDV